MLTLTTSGHQEVTFTPDKIGLSGIIHRSRSMTAFRSRFMTCLMTTIILPIRPFLKQYKLVAVGLFECLTFFNQQPRHDQFIPGPGRITP